MSSFNTCQFCLAKGCTKDVFSEYYHNGQKEVYSEIILNTFNINILQNTLNKICEQCIDNLRSSLEFKIKVLNSMTFLEGGSAMLAKDIDRYYDDFDDKLSVTFDDTTWAQDYCENENGNVFVVKLKQTNVDDDDDGQPPVTNDDELKEVVEQNHSKQHTRILRNDKNKNIEDLQRDTTRKTKQPESQYRKDLKQNSLNLVFNSNLCLFKSLKTKFGCFNCPKAFLTIQELRQHSKIHSDKQSVRAKFYRLRGLSYHNADISSLKCTKCEQACLDLTELEKHLVEKHGVEFGEAGNFLIPYKLEDSLDCVVCNDRFNTYMRLSIHMNQHYSNNVCEICGSSYINRISLRIHLQSRHREKECSLCAETFATYYARVRHMRTHHNSSTSKRYCLICGETFRYTYQLMEHKISEHGVKRQWSKCKLCPKTFQNPQNLSTHIRSVHVGERNFPCSLCDMRFFTKFDQKRHAKTHVDERSFACDYCESKFKGKDTLRRHLKRQHGQMDT